MLRLPVEVRGNRRLLNVCTIRRGIVGNHGKMPGFCQDRGAPASARFPTGGGVIHRGGGAGVLGFPSGARRHLSGFVRGASWVGLPAGVRKGAALGFFFIKVPGELFGQGRRFERVYFRLSP